MLRALRELAPIHPGSALHARDSYAQQVVHWRPGYREVHSHLDLPWAEGAELRGLLLRSDRQAPHASGADEEGILAHHASEWDVLAHPAPSFPVCATPPLFEGAGRLD